MMTRTWIEPTRLHAPHATAKWACSPEVAWLVQAAVLGETAVHVKERASSIPAGGGSAGAGGPHHLRRLQQAGHPSQDCWLLIQGRRTMEGSIRVDTLRPADDSPTASFVATGARRRCPDANVIHCCRQ